MSGLHAAWATITDLPSPCDQAASDPDLVTIDLLVASEVLYHLTKRRWPGVGESTVRPCGRGCRAPGLHRCGCGWVDEVLLPNGPVVEVVEVLVDGVEVDPGEYRIDDGNKLVGLEKLDGTLRTWPVCQRLARPTTEEGTFSVTYAHGAAPTTSGQRMAGVLACQIGLSRDPQALKDGRCRLPKRVTTVSRQGVTAAVVDPLTLFRDGQTGLAEVDLWVGAVNYGDQHHAATFVDPLRPPSVRRS